MRMVMVNAEPAGTFLALADVERSTAQIAIVIHNPREKAYKWHAVLLC